MEEKNNLLDSIEEEDENYNDSLQVEENESSNNSQPAPDIYNENSNDSQPAPCVPKDKKHSKCIEEILSLEDLFPAPLETKDEFEVIKMHAGNTDRNYARIFFEFNEGANIEESKQELKLVKENGGELNKDILKNVKRVVVDRTKIDGYSQGKANDEIIFNEDNELISVRFVEKPKEDQIETGKGLCGNTVYNKVMVLKYDNKYQGTQEFIVDMDNNLIITTDNLKLYWHSKDDNAGGNGFDDKETPVYISSINENDIPMYNHFYINNAIKLKDDQLYQNAMKQISKSKYIYDINYVYSNKQECKESYHDPFEIAEEWKKNICDFLNTQAELFKTIVKNNKSGSTKEKEIQEFCNSFKDCLLGHNDKLNDNIIMTSSHDSDKRVSVDYLLSHFNKSFDNNKTEYEKMQKIIYPVFEKITNFIKQIKEKVKEIEEQSTTQQNFTIINNKKGENDNGLKNITTKQYHSSYNDAKIKMETDEQKTKCDCGCDFGLPNCLKNFLGK